ncbi:Gfo/Idh/MocA family protein [Desulfosudis oleivorans]|uniref:Oxidoreductase domain protein n=1 Tax=Desulfosudis oleivorans (strain DSM 6200 / JCM 39069 / Hxd3) TaxID=96561 RepID=A8ZY14_DESOH|nr:Gfo/Idh/MocA family oxidoreductase [Desulfosudis oleivorans]ABW68641.1 oxidoreductase domain protein [Desulfosudis oleivorans Hxd3]
MEKLRVGVVGTGYLGKFHAEKYAAIEDVNLVGVVDIDRAAAEAVAGKLNTTARTDFRDLFGRVDAVSIVVPTRYHFEVARAFLEQGVDILLEKPMTETLDEADRLVEMAESTGAVFQVGHLERFNPAVAPLKGIVKKPLFIESHRLSIYKPRGTDVSVVLDLMIHDIDIILNFVSSEVTDIRAAGMAVISDSVDIANARLEFANGCVANVTASRISTRNERKLRMFQKEAYIAIDFANSDITIVDKSGDGDASSFIPGLTVKNLSFMKWDALEQEVRAFVKSVRRRETPEVSGRVGREALRVALNVADQIQRTGDRIG